MKIGIAISLYDKFEELEVLVDIIRNNWKRKYIISVCSNHPDAKKYIKNLDIDIFTQGENIYFSSDLPYIRKHINLTCRVLDTIRKSCLGANSLGAEYVMHLHTDAWPLKEEEFLELVNFIKKNNFKFAARGMGLGKCRPDTPLGHLDDMFFIYNVKFVEEKNFFDFNPLAMLPLRLTVHGVLSTLVVSKIGLDNFYLYENHTDLEYWDGKKATPLFERGKPSIYDKKRGFLHVHVQSFPGEYGKNVQAYYLAKNKITKGEHIREFLKKYLIPEERLFEDLRNLEKKLNRKLRLHGYFLSLERFGRDFNKKIAYLKMPFNEKIRFLFVSALRSLWTSLFAKRKTGKYFGIELYPEISVWPEYLGSFYAKNLKPSDYPKEWLWFLKNKQV